MNKISCIGPLLALMICLKPFTGLAQVDADAYGYYQDALRFSRLLYGGSSARSMSMGGVGASVGADASSGYTNPAGLGVFRKSELSFSPNFTFGGASANFQGEDQRDLRSGFNFNNLSVVFCGAKDDLNEDKWRGGSFSISYVKTNNFNSKFSYTGVNTKNNFADYLVEQANGTPVSDLDNSILDPDNYVTTDLVAAAYWAFVINPDPLNSTAYYSFIEGDAVRQEETVTTKGGQGEWNIAYGGNYMDKLYIGASLGISTIRYIKQRSYKETVGFMSGNKFVESPDLLIDYTVDDYLKVTGTGINLKMGFMYNASDAIRLGLLLQSPNVYTMKDSYLSSITANFEATTTPSGYLLKYENWKTQEGFFRYNHTSPLRVRPSLTVFAGKKGFISADVEMVPYNLASFGGKTITDESLLQPDNKTIRNLYKTALNYRVGGELRLGMARLRAGGAYFSSPYRQATDGLKNDLLQISVGAGFKLEEYFLDFALVNSKNTGKYRPYTLSSGQEPEATLKNSMTNFVITTGLYF